MTVCTILLHRLEPIMRARVIDTLSTRFQSRVELAEFHASIYRGFEISGKGLRLYPENLEQAEPLFALNGFSFHTGWVNLLRTPMHVHQVRLNGLKINMPPKQQRKEVPHPSGKKHGIKIVVDEIACTDALLTLGTNKPGKEPLRFAIRNLNLQSVGADRPMHFTAVLTNPKPVGDINTIGDFGPFNASDPGSTPLNGKYEFTHADLGTLKGIGGILSSTGQYKGVLNNITVDGQTDTPDFRVDVSGNAVHLRTQFHAIVDGTNGNTYLQPVVGSFLNSSLIAKGYVVGVPGGKGHHIYLDVQMDKACIEDLLTIGVKTDPPFMRGPVRLTAKLAILPGKKPVPEKLLLDGDFEVHDASFTNPKVQTKVDEMSLRASGKLEMARQESKHADTVTVQSRMRGHFNLNHGKLTITGVHYNLPGAEIVMNGIYTLDGNQFEFSGEVRTTARISRMMGGWKGALVTPLDPIFAKRGFGAVIPVKITGTRSEPHFGLNLNPEPPEQRQKELERTIVLPQ